MTGPKLQQWQTEHHPTAEERAALAREFATPRHIPNRSCLGCGGTMRDGWYGQCHSWGVEAWRSTHKLGDETTSRFSSECYRLSWVEVARLASVDGVQQELSL